ncbi:MAG: class I SAM-dependent methyltransferase [Anaerolinea sp.]|nr:class I SAM-dependent methyltransferase [Anaerolinea sp.]
MAVQDRIHWDARHRASRDRAYPDPDPLLFMYTPPTATYQARGRLSGERPRALDLACGLGQNGLWLAAQGYSVDMIDISREALLIARQVAASRGLRTLNFLQSDLDETALQSEAYDVVCVFRFLKRNLFERIRASVRPGGRVIYATHTTGWKAIRPEACDRYLLHSGELIGYFSDWRILHQRETECEAEIVALKPETGS